MADADSPGRRPPGSLGRARSGGKTSGDGEAFWTKTDGASGAPEGCIGHRRRHSGGPDHPDDAISPARCTVISASESSCGVLSFSPRRYMLSFAAGLGPDYKRYVELASPASESMLIRFARTTDFSSISTSTWLCVAAQRRVASVVAQSYTAECLRAKITAHFLVAPSRSCSQLRDF